MGNNTHENNLSFTDMIPWVIGSSILIIIIIIYRCKLRRRGRINNPNLNISLV